MKKGILIIGKPQSGKSRLASLLMSDKEFIIINGRQDLVNNNFLFSLCKKSTEFIFIDDFNIKLNDMYFLINIIDKVNVGKPYEKSFTINPKIIVSISLINSDNLDLTYLSEYFEIFELKNLLNLNKY